MMTSRPNLHQPDPRRNAYRDDLAAESLRGVVEADRYVAGEARQVCVAHVALRKAPDFGRGLETELLFGERVTVFDTVGGWAFVQAERDRYVGYVQMSALTATLTDATHHVRSIGSFVYPEPSIKTPPALHLSLNATVAVLETRDRFAALATGGFVIAHHIAAIDQPARDFVAVAERLENTPYLWGGRTRLGLDCSGLVQLSMQAAGLTCPRDTDMQRDEVGTVVDVPTQLLEPKSDLVDIADLQRGDLIFWKGHVGIMIDGHMLLHANGHHMSTIVEPVLDAAVRIFRQEALPVIAIRRPAALSVLGS